MIRHRGIVAVLLIYSISTDAAEFSDDLQAMRNLLRNEPTAGERKDILCHKLDNNLKQIVCDEIMDYLVQVDYKHEHPTFKHRRDLYPREETGIYGTDEYECTKRSIEELKMVKPMYWCKSKQFYKTHSDAYETLDGFYCAGSLNDPRTVYVLRPYMEDIVDLVGVAQKVYIPSNVLKSK